MTRKLNYIPYLNNYDDVRQMMKDDLAYRLDSRQNKTSLGRPLYYRINIQLIMTHECPYHCPFCLERKNPMEGEQDFDAQLESLEAVLSEHKSARLTITGGEPGLYPDHVKNIERVFIDNSDNVFITVNTAGINSDIVEHSHINLSWNDYVHPNASLFKDCTLQTVFDDEHMTLNEIKKFIIEHQEANNFSFRFISGLDKHEYPVDVWNDMQNDSDFHINTFRVGDFFMYATFNWNGKHGRVTLGDMYQQRQNDYKDGYSNIIIHPNGNVATNWK